MYGAGLAWAAMELVTCTLLTVASIYNPISRQCMKMPDSRIFTGVWAYLKNALNQILILMTEMWIRSSMTFIAGLIGTAEVVAAQTLLTN